MASYSSNLKLTLLATGEQPGQWGDTTNVNLGTLLEQAISGYVTQAITDGADTTITMPDGASGVARNMYLELTGTLTAARNLIVPANRKLYFIYNNTTGGFAVTVKVSGLTGISVPNGSKYLLVCNGTDIVTATNIFAGTANYIPVFNSTNKLTNSAIYQDSTSGNIGIGTTTPTYKFQLLGTAGSTTPLFSMGIAGITNGFTISTDASNNISYRFSTKTGAVGIYQKSDGYVGIGTTNPIFPLDVTGPGGIGGIFLSSITTPNFFNICIGSSGGICGYAISGTSGYNVAVGPYTLLGQEGFGPYTIYGNVAIGHSALNGGYSENDASLGSFNVVMGYQAASSGCGSNNVLIGRDVANNYGAGTDISTYTNCTIVGASAAAVLTTGSNNIWIGKEAGAALNNISNSVIIGSYKGDTAPFSGTGIDNYIVISDGAGNVRQYFDETGGCHIGNINELYVGSPYYDNVVLGASSLTNIVDGESNTVVGTQSASNLTSGSFNTVLGAYALNGTDVAVSANTAIGHFALGQIGGNHNTAIGYLTMSAATTAIGNLALGSYAGLPLTTGDGNIFIGGVNHTGAYYPVYSITTQNNYISLGSTSVTNAYIQVAWTVVSDARDKTNFGVVPHGLNFVSQLNPVSYQFKMSREDDTPNGNVRYGFKAQDVLALEGDNSVIIDAQNPDKLYYNSDSLVPVLVNAIKELKVELDALKAELQTLKGA